MSRTERTENRPRNWYLWSEPKWWRRMYKHVKRRNEVKRYIYRGDWDNSCPPLDKKPWVYYW